MFFMTEAHAQEAPAETGADSHESPAAGELHNEVGVPAEHHGGGVFPPFDQSTYVSQLFWLVIVFGFFYALMQKVIVPRIGNTLEQRHARISQDIESAAQFKAEADAVVAAYESEIAAARTKAGTIGSAARDSAKAKADAERQSIEASLSEKLKAAEARIADIKAKAFADVGAIAEETAAAVVEQLIGNANIGNDIAAAVASAKTGN